MFAFEGKWYITYHSRILEEAMGLEGGYRSTNVDALVLSDTGCPTVSRGTRTGVEQVKPLDPYEEVAAVTMATCSGIKTKQYGETAEKYGSGEMILGGIQDGSWMGVYGADFGAEGASKVAFSLRGQGSGVIRISLDTPAGEVIGYVPFEAPGKEFTTLEADLLKAPAGEHNVFFTFAGEGVEVRSWRFIR